MSHKRVLLTALLLVCLCGCAAAPQQDTSGPRIDREVLLAGPAELAAPLPAVNLLEMDAEMRAFLAEHIPENATERRKVWLLLQAFFGRDGIQIQYENIKTHTARETFHTRQGNCLSFTSLFIAMARELGLDASFQEVRTPVVWNSQGDLYIFNRHINVIIEFLHRREQVVDFDMQNFSEHYPRWRISDRAALAQYHSNMGVHWMLQEDARKALAHQREALRLLPRTGYMWTNLGAIYSRFGYSDLAEAAFLTALKHEPSEFVAISNLARFYSKRGQEQLALQYATRADKFRRRNPYYLYARAEELYADGDFDAAVGELRRAIRLEDADHNFHRLLGLTMLQLGDARRAKSSFSKAAELAEVPEYANLYARKLQMLSGRR